MNLTRPEKKESKHLTHSVRDDDGESAWCDTCQEVTKESPIWDNGYNQALSDMFAYQNQQMEEILAKYYNCDNPNCGNGAICNYCALRKDLATKIMELVGDKK